MKKEYKAPVMLVVNVKMESLLDTLSRGEDWTKGDSAGREDNSDWDE